MPSDAELLILSGPQVEPLLNPTEVLEAVRAAFVLHSERQGRVFPVVREHLDTGGVFGIKSGDVQARGLLGFKAAGFWPTNRDRGSEPHQATIMLFDPATGRPTCLIDGNAVTTARTGAAGALGMRHLARPDSARLCIFGTGVQARVQLTRTLEVLPAIREVRYLTAQGEPDADFEAAFAQSRTIRHVTNASAAVAASNVVITATPGNGPLFAAEAVQPGTHINAVGADTKGKRELPPGLLDKARVVVDDQEQAHRIGESQWYDHLDVTEIGDVLTGRVRFVRAATDITVFDMTGLALQDLTVAGMLESRARDGGHGTRTPWPW
ncbi:ornithine cyclodeaminase family protein [Methylobacterium radiodurans]|uniref:Ornithine cyclodeaminase n=1 Tax=Methylobacterium radiodurans TaxID=2202828 RepID=A0A2U8VX51_9HYPH|nr:ornithine cyclodeaminase family protein [Methylobacterium radiodurans]AWN38367.1 ornithine cyclodeaminase [Methylobacterium radiodurans]